MSFNKPVFRLPDNDDHDRVSALFLGPKAENSALLRHCFDLIVARQSDGRKAYFPQDPNFISQGLQESPAFKAKTQQLNDSLESLLFHLNKFSIPFYSPRYSAHMCVDQSLPAILGYLSTMFYNPNNVAFEASPFTTQIELLVGQQLCAMMGYNIVENNTVLPLSWGHITCDGTIANLESIWAARNMKFYPFSLRDAIAPDAPLSFIRDTFKIELCAGQTKLLKDCVEWELLNLKVPTILEIPERLYKEYRITNTFLDSVMQKYTIQSTSKDTLMEKWGIKSQPVIFVPSTKHYSWPKGAAITGIGSDNALNVPIDRDARMNTEILKNELRKCITDNRAVYEVVAVMGTTEEGAVDRLSEIVAIRNELQKEGLSFVVHADAAWGGYFASMLAPEPVEGLPVGRDLPGDFVPHVGLRADTAAELRSLKDADVITIDPHKAGYIPYPAGGLCYRDGRMRYLVTWTAPYINQGVKAGESIGVYGVEGSKPGASAAAVYLSHQVIGLGPDGHGTLLGEASFTCRRFASFWASLSDDNTDFIVVPLNLLPSEKDPHSTPKKIKDEKDFIRKHILHVKNADLVKDDKAMQLLNELGSDLNINAFACNFRYRDGTLNKDILEANWLNKRIFEKLSVTDPEEDPLSIPFYLTSTVFAENDYGECNKYFKQRLGLEGKQDLFVLRNVVMSPFATTHEFVADMAKIFREVLEEEVKNVRERNEAKPDKHTFLVQGGSKLHLVHMPSFHMASGRRQFIFSADLSVNGMEKYRKAVSSSQGLPFLRNTEPLLIDEIKDGSAFEAEVYFEGSPVTIKVEVVNVKIVKKRSLDTEDLDSAYPKLMPFYLYGTPEQPHLDHMLTLAPNIQLTAGRISLSLKDSLQADDLTKGLIVIARDIHEQSMQPFPKMELLDIDDNFFFSEGKEHEVTVYRDPFPASTMDPIPLEKVKEVVTTGKLKLVGDLYVDSDRLNSDKSVAGQAPFQFNPSGQMSNNLKQRWVDTVGVFHDEMSK